MMEQMIGGYEDAFAGNVDQNKEADPLPMPLHFILKEALRRKWSEMAAERIKDETPTIPLGKRFWKLSGEERRDIDTLFASEEARKLVTALKHRSNDAPVRVMDAAYWVKGCSSLGLLRYAVLIQVDKGKDK